MERCRRPPRSLPAPCAEHPTHITKQRRCIIRTTHPAENTHHPLKTICVAHAADYARRATRTQRQRTMHNSEYAQYALCTSRKICNTITCDDYCAQHISRTERTTHGTRLALYAMSRACTAHRTQHARHSVRTTRTTHGTHYARHAMCTAFALHYARQTLRAANTMNGGTTHNTHCARHTNLKETRHRTRCTFRIVRDEHGNRIAHDKHCARAGHNP